MYCTKQQCDEMHSNRMISTALSRNTQELDEMRPERDTTTMSSYQASSILSIERSPSHATHLISLALNAFHPIENISFHQAHSIPFGAHQAHSFH